MNSHSENDIARVLTGLRDTQPSAGLEQRILHGLQHRAAARTPLFMRWQLVAAVPAAAFAIFVMTRFVATNHPATLAPTATSMPAPTTVAGSSSSNARLLSSIPPTALSSRPEAAHFAAAVERPAVPTIAAQLSAADREALENINAPSRPAPPLPLTRDERMLAAAARRAGSVEVAQLDALTEDPLHAATSAREDAAVRMAVQRLLHQLAAAETLNPTPPAPEASFSNIPAESAPETESAPNSQ